SCPVDRPDNLSVPHRYRDSVLDNGPVMSGPRTRSNHAFIRATWLPGQNQRPHEGHEVSGQPERATRVGTSPVASNADRDRSATLHAGQRLQRAPEGTWCAATSRTAAASSPRATRSTATPPAGR